MKTKLCVLFILSLCLCNRGHAEVSPLLNDYLGLSTLIKVADGSGTGFFLQASNSLYLVTARHVLYYANPQTGWTLRAPSIACLFYTQGKKGLLTLNLTNLQQSGDVRFSEVHDIAMVRFEDTNPTNSQIAIINQNAIFGEGPRMVVQTLSSITKRFANVEAGSDVFLIGYPDSIGLTETPQITSDLPLLRKGIVAAKDLTRHTFVLDCPSYPGNSGGPVIEREQNPDGVSIYFVGIVTEFVPFRQTWRNERYGLVNQEVSNSGYSVVEPIDNVLDMVWK